MLFSLLLGLITLIIWLLLDFKLGRTHHLRNVKNREYPVRNGKWMFFGNGHDLYSNLFEDIRSAKDHIHILFYIIKKDQTSKDFLELLQKKAKEGITVRLLLDRVGSQLPKKEIKRLKESGVQFMYSHRPHFPYFFYSLNYRNHRKITVIDGTIGYFGGFNIGKEYLGHDPKLGFWRDFHMKIFGDGVQDLQSEFLYDWKRASKKDLFQVNKYFPALPKGKTPLKFIPTDGVYIKNLLIDLIDRAEFEVTIATPYFIPGKEVNRVILKARERGVKISIIVPMKADHLFVKEAAFPYFKPLLQAGCKVYQYTNGFYHGKVILIDDKICDFGTANFDKRSFYINDELNCIIEDPVFIERIYKELSNDIENSKLLTKERYKKRPLFQRGKEVVSTLISDLL